MIGYISTCGYGITVFTDAGIQYIGEQIKEDLSDGDFQKPLTNSSGFATILSHRQEVAIPTIRIICPKSRFL